MTGTNHTSSHTRQDNFDTDGVSISIDNCCSVSMSHSNQDFVGILKNGRSIINGFDGPKVHTIYEVTITWTNNDNYGNTHQIEIMNYLYGNK